MAKLTTRTKEEDEEGPTSNLSTASNKHRDHFVHLLKRSARSDHHEESSLNRPDAPHSRLVQLPLNSDRVTL